MRPVPSVAAKIGRPKRRSYGIAVDLLDWRWILYLQIRALGFVATSLLIVWGTLLAAVFCLGAFSLDGLMWQLDNLASRYLAAEPERRLQFEQIFIFAHVALGIVVLAVRLRALRPSMAEPGLRS